MSSELAQKFTSRWMAPQPCLFNQHYGESLQNLHKILENKVSQKSLFSKKLINETCCPIQIF